MPRHRAPSSPVRSLTSLAVAGAAVGGSLLTPSVALAATAPADPGATSHDLGDAPAVDALASRPDRGHDRHDDARPARHRTQAAAHGTRHRVAPARHSRPMTSGEEQLRNNCRHGLVTDGCQLIDPKRLLQQGINPTL
jgi:hypothetical protein